MTFGRRKKPSVATSRAELQRRSQHDKAQRYRDEADATLPPALRIAGAWSWRLLVIVAVIALVIALVITLRDIVVPFMVAILLAALLLPFVNFLRRHGWPKGLAVALAEVGLLVIVAGLVVLVVFQVRDGFPDLQTKSIAAYDDFKKYLLDSPLQITNTDIMNVVNQAVSALQENGQSLFSGAVLVGSSAGHFLAGILLTLFATLFMLIDGPRIWQWVVRLFPRHARPAVNGSGRAGWVTLTNFVRVQIVVAFIDAVGIGLGAFILGLFFGGFPLVIPIAIAVFLGSFVPVIGSVFTGVLAVFVALVYLNPFAALVMLIIVIAVQQIEGHVLQPFVMGTAVRVHPLAVVFSVAAGGFLAGIAGALFAVPVVATLNVMISYIASGRWRTEQNPDLETAVQNA